MKFLVKILAIILLFVLDVLQAQNGYDSLRSKIKMQFYGNLYHQHHDFFDKAFSFQGLDIGFLLNQNLILGIYCSCFVTNLKTEINNKMQFIWIGQSGINIGYIYKAENRIHPGIQLSSGIFCLRTDDKNFGLFQANQAEFKFNGLVIAPQFFGELDITEWFRIRTGLSYNFYFYKDHSVIRSSDLDHLSFTFGLVFLSK